MRLSHRRSLIVLAIAAMAVGIVIQGPAPSMVSAGSRSPHPVLIRVSAQGLAASPKPDWRGADLGNTGRMPAYAAVVTPTQVFSVKPITFGVTGGIELAPDGNVIFTADKGNIFAYHPDGTLKWAAPTLFVTQSIGTYFGSDLAASGSNPVITADSTIYIGNDNGNLYQVDGATGVAQSIFSSVTGKGIVQTPKIAPDGSLYVGTADGVFYHLTPPALGSGGAATQLYAFAAQGSTQTDGAYAGTTSTSPFLFYGEAALDGAGNAYAASTDTNPTTSTPTLGTLYQIKPDGTLGWKAPLQGAVAGAVLLAPNPAAPGQTLVVVADRNPEVAAFDAATGARVWDYVPSLEADPFAASPALSADGATVYVPNTGNSFFGLSLASGTLVPSFGSGGIVTVPGGSSSSPIVDAAGDIFLESTAGVLNAYTPAGTQLWSVPAGSASGSSGSGGARFMSPAIGADGTLYVGGNKATVRGFLGTLPPTNTPAPTITPGGATVTPTSSSTPSPSATTSPTASPTPSPTPSATGTAVTPTASGTATSTPTRTATATLTNSPTVTSTPTTSPTITVTVTPSETAVPTDTPADSPTETPATSPTETPTSPVVQSSAVTTTLEIHNWPRTLLLTQPRTTPCDLATNEQHLEDGCIRISTITAPKSLVTVVLTYPDGTPQYFSEVNDARGHSLHVYNTPYAPPAKANLPRAATIVNITAIVVFPGGLSSAVTTTRFRIMPPPDSISAHVGRPRRH